MSVPVNVYACVSVCTQNSWQMYARSCILFWCMRVCRPVEWRKTSRKSITTTAAATAAADSWTTNEIDDGRCFNLSIRTILDRSHAYILLFWQEGHFYLFIAQVFKIFQNVKKKKKKKKGKKRKKLWSYTRRQNEKLKWLWLQIAWNFGKFGEKKTLTHHNYIKPRNIWKWVNRFRIIRFRIIWEKLRKTKSRRI